MLHDVELIHDDDRELVFAHRPWKGWAISVVSAAGLIALLLLKLVINYRFSSWALFFLLTFLTSSFLSGLAFARRRFELRLGFISGVYVRTEGIGGKSTSRGLLSEIQTVSLQTRVATDAQGRNERTVWLLRLEFTDPGKSLNIFETETEEIAYSKLEELARKLKVPSVDLTDRIQASLPLKEPRRGPTSGIVVSENPRGKIIVLPCLGVHTGAAVLTIFAFIFVALGYWIPAALAGFGVDLSSASETLLRASCLLMGLLVFGLAVTRCAAREFVREEKSSLQFGYSIFDISLESRRMEKAHIKEIDIKHGPIGTYLDFERLGPFQFAAADLSADLVDAPADDVFVRSDRAIVRLGRGLDADDKVWLLDELTAWLARP